MTGFKFLLVYYDFSEMGDGGVPQLQGIFKTMDEARQLMYAQISNASGGYSFQDLKGNGSIKTYGDTVQYDYAKWDIVKVGVDKPFAVLYTKNDAGDNSLVVKSYDTLEAATDGLETSRQDFVDESVEYYQQHGWTYEDIHVYKGAGDVPTPYIITSVGDQYGGELYFVGNIVQI